MEAVSVTVDQLGELMGAVSIDTPEELLSALTVCDRFRATVAQAVAGFAVSGEWQVDGAVSMTSWLQHHAPMAHADAVRLLRDGRFLARYTPVADGLQSGALCGAQVAALQAVVSKPTADQFEEDAGVVVASITGLDLADTGLACQHWQERAEAIVDMPEPKLPEQSLRTATLGDGTTVTQLVLGPAASASFDKALETARRWDGSEDTRTPKQRSADAFESVLDFFNANHDRADKPRHRPHVELHIQANELTGTNGACAVTTEGRLVPTWATDVWLCDCVIHRVLRAGSAVSDYGRATRSVPTNLYRMVVTRDGGCRFPCCDRKVAWCDAHHIRWWRKHGETKLDNLLLLCGYHHRIVHRQQWDTQLHADAAVTFTSPAGRVVTTRPHPLGVPVDRPPGAGPPIAA